MGEVVVRDLCWPVIYFEGYRVGLLEQVDDLPDLLRPEPFDQVLYGRQVGQQARIASARSSL